MKVYIRLLVYLIHLHTLATVEHVSVGYGCGSKPFWDPSLWLLGEFTTRCRAYFSGLD